MQDEMERFAPPNEMPMENWNLCVECMWHMFQPSGFMVTSLLGSALMDEIPLRLRGLAPVDQPKLRLCDIPSDEEYRKTAVMDLSGYQYGILSEESSFEITSFETL